MARSPTLGLACLLALLPASVWAGTPTDQLRAAADQVRGILEDPALEAEDRVQERQAAVRAELVDLFDFTEISRRALGRHWRPLSESERGEFVTVFRAFLEQNYLPRIKLYQGERLEFLREDVEGRTASVHAEMTRPGGQTVPVTFRLHRSDERWLVFDMIVEGISLVGNYRSQFNRIIGRASYQALVVRMQQRLAEDSVGRTTDSARGE